MRRIGGDSGSMEALYRKLNGQKGRTPSIARLDALVTRPEAKERYAEGESRGNARMWHLQNHNQKA